MIYIEKRDAQIYPWLPQLTYVMNKTKIFFLGGIFTPGQSNYINNKSLGVIQNAADSLQKKIIYGFDSLENVDIRVINLPFVGSYPSLFKDFYFPNEDSVIFKKTSVTSIGFINVFFAKIFFRFYESLKALKKVRFCNDSILIVYSAHLPFLASSVIVRYLNPSLKLCLILPDLPEFMGEGGFFYRAFKRIDTVAFYYLVKKFQYHVVLTRHMGLRINAKNNNFLVIEGVASEGVARQRDLEIHSSKIRAFLYSGTLARRYGIVNLIEAFSKLNNIFVELWICGDGDAREFVLNSAVLDNRIKFFGQIKRDDVLDLQMKASVLVNPRTPEGEYTKYSFPSKVMEYMASGRPVIMYKLDGIPDEYDPYYIAPEGVDIDALSTCMAHVAAMNDDQLNQLGQEARDFVLREKNPTTQAKKILNLVMEIQ